MPNISLPHGIFPVDIILRWLYATLPEETYHYLFLDPNVREIRLVSLLPGPATADIECLLSHASLDQNPHYEALSYAWGEQKEEIRIVKLEGHAFPITSNLEIALRHLRHETETRTLWVDAISINQIDDNEKSHQVREMTSIYQSASRVLIWLGEEKDDSDLAMNIVQSIGATGFNQIQIDEQHPAPWVALRTLFYRAWWFRAWVLQEATVNKIDPLVGCGQKWVSWSAFDVVHSFIMSQLNLGSSGSRMVLQATKSQVSAIHEIREHLKKGSPHVRIEPLMRMAMTFESRDPRDKLFSLYGIAHKEDQDLLIPDYTKSVRELYTELAVHLIAHNINMLFVNTNSPDNRLPSWVPDWSWASRRWCLWIENIYKASGITKSGWRFSTNPDTLSIPGVIIDHVAVTDELFPRGGAPLVPYRTGLPAIVDSIESLIEKTNEEKGLGYTDSLEPDDLWRTLLANKTLAMSELEQRYPAPAMYGEMFKVFRGRATIPSTFKPDLAPARRRELFVQPFETALHGSMEDQRFFITRNGRIGIGPRDLAANDLLVIFWGADMPVVLREKEGFQQLLGATYLHGVMDGEIFEPLSQENIRDQSEVFVLR